MQYHAIPCITMHYHAIPCNTMQYHTIPCNTMQYHAILCNTMQYHAIPCIITNCWRSLPLPCGQYNGHFLSQQSWRSHIFRRHVGEKAILWLHYQEVRRPQLIICIFGLVRWTALRNTCPLGANAQSFMNVIAKLTENRHQISLESIKSLFKQTNYF